MGFEYRLLARRPRIARDVGSAVRRLRQRRAGHHRPVPRVRRVEVEPLQRPRRCSCRTATKGRGPSTPPRGSNASCRCAPRTTSRSRIPTTPAQYFHLLRRQVKRNFRKPLVVMTPKSLLRHRPRPRRSSEFTDRASFREVLDDAAANPELVTRVLLCSGKVYYDLAKKRDELDDAGGRDRAARAALPVAGGAARSGPRPVPPRPRVGLGAGGIAEHGRAGRSPSRGCGR